jgi:hypothetical protein
VQVNVKELVSSVVVPNMKLREIVRISIKTGATESVDLKVSGWGLWNVKIGVCCPGWGVIVLVGASSKDLRGDVSVTAV